MSWLFKRSDSEYWWIGYRHNGSQFRKSTKHTNREKAEKELAKLDMMFGAQHAGILTYEMYQQITGRALPRQTLKAALDGWIAEATGATAPRTAEKYSAFAEQLCQFFHATEQGPMVSDITREQLQEFLTEKRKTVSASTVNMARKCLAIFFRRATVNGVIRDNPVLGVKLFKASREEKRVRRPFTAKELGSLYSAAPDDFWRYMVLGGFFTGLRLGDLVTMPVGAVDFRARTINLLTRKTGATMHIPIAPKYHALLLKLKAGRKGAKPVDPFWPEHAKRYEATGSGWFSQRFYDLVLVPAGLAKSRPHRPGKKSHKEKRQVNEVSFHCLRHSFVSTLAALGENQQTVKALAGHSSDEISDLYTKLPPSVLRDAVRLLPDITK